MLFIHMLLINVGDFGGNRKAKSLWSCIVYANFWTIWLERNAKKIYDKETDVDSLWEKVGHFCFGLCVSLI